MEEGRGIEPPGGYSRRGFQDRLSPWMLPSKNILDCRLPIANLEFCIRPLVFLMFLPRLVTDAAS